MSVGELYSVVLANGREFRGILKYISKDVCYFMAIDDLGRLEEYILLKRDFIKYYGEADSRLKEYLEYNLKENTFNSYNTEYLRVEEDPFREVICHLTSTGEVISYVDINEGVCYGIISGFLSKNLNIERIDPDSIRFIGSVRISAERIKCICFNGPKFILLKKSYERKIRLS